MPFGQDEEDSGIRKDLENAVDQVIPDPQPQETTVEVAAPETWEENDKQLFGTITDQKVRQWLVDRDKSYGEKITGYESKYKGFDEVFEPHRERLSQMGQQPVDVIKNLLAAQVALEERPEEAFKWLAQRFNVDLKKLVGAAPDGQQPDGEVDPLADLDPKFRDYLKSLEERAALGENFVKTQQTQEQQRVIQNVNTSLASFREAKDEKTKQPLHPFVTDERVSKRMATLIQTGEVPIVGGDLNTAFKEAYDQAVYSFPDLREKLKPQAEEVTRERVLSARRAGVGVKGSGTPSASQSAEGGLRQQLRKNAENAGLI